MDPLSPLLAMAAMLVAIATMFLIVKFCGAPAANQSHFSSLDGLRGYLAYFVFLHHSCIWYFYLHTGSWDVPPSNFYAHLGQSSVALFFMISGFLFFSKLLDGRKRTIDWGRLFVSRFLRLLPLYLFAVLLLFLVVAYLSDGIVKESVASIAKGGISWLWFTVAGEPNLNGIEHTKLIIAGVTWSLPYEWFFYFSLPLLALVVRVRPPAIYLAFGILSIATMLFFWHPERHNLLSFLGGIGSAVLVRSEFFCRLAAQKVSSVIVLGCIGIVIAGYHSPYKPVPLLLLALAFALIACGNDMFGILQSRVSRTLGEMAYSIYLLHGIVLFTVFRFAVGLRVAKTLSPTVHWILVAAVTPFLLSFCLVTFRLIEQPAMQSVTPVTAWLRGRFGRQIVMRRSSYLLAFARRLRE